MSATQPTGAPAQRALAWGSVLVWVGIILVLSGDDFSAGTTSRFLGPFLQWLFPDLSPERFEAIHFAVRKGAHAFEYGVLALLAQRAFRLDGVGEGWYGVAGAMALVSAIAGADELRQSLSMARTGARSDIALDVAGGAAALAIGAAFRRLRFW